MNRPLVIEEERINFEGGANESIAVDDEREF